MNRSGLVRQLDKLGRVSIPAEIRRSLNIREKNMVEFSVDGSRVYFERYTKVCLLCGRSEDVEVVIIPDTNGGHPTRVCRSCMLQIAEYLKNPQGKIRPKSRLEELI